MFASELPDTTAADSESISVAIHQYRELLNDWESSDEQVRIKLEFIENLCRKIIKNELNQLTK